MSRQPRGYAGRVAATAAAVCLGLTACGSGGGSHPPAGPAAGSAAPTGEVAASSQEVSFDANGTTTYGTLEVPAHRSGQHLAAALLLAGSGPTDRNGDQPPPSPPPGTLQKTADALAGMGIMSLRFDKYFAGRTGAGSYTSNPGSIDLNAFIRQADDAYKLLASQPVADRQRLLVVGHSEGGLYGILVAETAAPHPAGLALVEPLDERFLDLVALQINESLEAQVSQGTITADTARGNAQGVRDAVAEFRAGQPVNTANLLPAVVSTLSSLILSPINARYVHTVDAIDPPVYAAKLPAGTRVLVTDGSADTKVPPSTIQPLVDALASAGTTGPGLQTLTGLNHYLVPPAVQPSGAPLDPAFLAALRSWAQPYTPAP